MKEKDIKSKYNIEIYKFVNYMKMNNLPYTETILGTIIVDDAVVDGYVAGFLKHQQETEQSLAEKKARQEEALALKEKAISEMLITSGFNFEGYSITKYSGYISGDDAISVDRGMAIFGNGKNVKNELMNSLVIIRKNALRELKEAAYNIGCNAVIGVDFDYLTLDPQTANLTGGTTYQPYVFGVTANGTAVVIEKNSN